VGCRNDRSRENRTSAAGRALWRATGRLGRARSSAESVRYKISISYPEFTCLCPRSGFPDFATIRITYVPDETIVELKALKLYLNRYRNEYVFHEAVVNRILDDLVASANPRWIRVVGDFNVRGNVKTLVTAVHQQEGYAGPPAYLHVEIEG
jgi:7-cyano-7-deazaguanine reductase